MRVQRSRGRGWPNRGTVAVAILLLTLTACAIPREFKPKSAEPPRQDGTVLLMPIDAELRLLLASGMQEPHAAWTKAGSENLYTAIKEVLQEHNTRVVDYVEDEDQIDTAEARLRKLHGSVGHSIMVAYSHPQFALPTKKDAFDWTLGESVSVLRERYGADYALFTHVRDSYSSGGRVALQIVGALLGVSVPGGGQVGFISLVDLHDGKVIWFSRRLSGAGDLRKLEPARVVVNYMLDGFPL